MTRDEAKAILESGGTLTAYGIIWTKHYMSCNEGCCDTDFSSVHETLDFIELVTFGWDEVRQI